MNSITDFLNMKKRGEKITLITCYDYLSAKILEKSGVDWVLVGDSVSMVMHGFANTTFATLDMMSVHTRAVANGLKHTFIVTDLPFLTHRKSLAHTMGAVEQLIQAGAHSVKIEGIIGNQKSIAHIVESGIPVMGHIGLTPQHIHQLGGYKVQGREASIAHQLMEQAKQCQDVGCFSLVLECVPAELAQQITHELSIPTIGIGAGRATDGQVLVYHDLLGLQTDITPRFVKQFCQGELLFIDGVKQYIAAVKDQQFPTREHSYEMH